MPADLHRSLGEHLREGGSEAVADLVLRRPDLVDEPVPVDVEALAARAETPASLDRAVAATTRPEDGLLQVVACLPPGATDDELARALPEGTGLDEIAEVLGRLDAAGLAWRHDGRIHCPQPLRTGMATAVGPPLHAFEEGLTLDHLKHAVRTLRATLTEAGGVGELPPWASAPRKAGLLVELAGLLGADGAAAAVVRVAPSEAAVLLRALLDGSHATELAHPLTFHRVAHRRSTQTSYRPPYADTPAYWLFERGLLLPVPEGSTTTLPRELVLSWQDGRPVADLALMAPEVVAGEADATEVDLTAAAAVTRLLDAVGDLLEAGAEVPVPALKGGGLGITALRSVASRLDVGVEETARVVELAHLAGLLAPLPSPDGAPGVVGPTPASEAWSRCPPARRWSQLATAWCRAATWPSRAARVRDGDAVLPALAPSEPEPAAVRARQGVLSILRGLEPGQRTDPSALAARVGWDRPHDWPGSVGVDPPIAIRWVGEETEVLGLAALGALSGFGRALLDGDPAGAEAALDVVLPPTETTFTIQADLTAVVLGRPERDVLLELRLLADVESTGVATTFRFTETSLRRALDAGRGVEAITAFLESHAPKGIPGSLAYLLTDVARRHGHLTVAGAATVVTGDDPAVLADAVASRGTRSLLLRLLAPTVAASARPPDEVMATLRAAGFLPVPDETSMAVVVARPVEVEGGETEAREPFAVATVEEGDAPDEETARRLALAIVDGSSPRSGSTGGHG